MINMKYNALFFLKFQKQRSTNVLIFYYKAKENEKNV